MSAQLDNSSQSLITRERTSKLELLIHLLANLSQPLVVCGPDGIGKTTLLNTVQLYKAELWRYCVVKGHANLSFEDVLKHIGHTLFPGITHLKVSQLHEVYSQYQIQNKKIVLMIDDAGLLVPGLITSIMQYAEANAAIRVVFTLTHDDMFVLGRSDRAIENCHFIELPPLSESQCGEFLRHLATKPRPQITLASITDELVGHTYRETRGIPGKILAELPVLAKPKAPNPMQWVLTFVLVVCLIALALEWLRSERNSVSHLFLTLKPEPKTVQPRIEEQVILAPPSVTEPKALVESIIEPDAEPASDQAIDPVNAPIQDSESFSQPEPFEPQESVVPNQPAVESKVQDEKQPVSEEPLVNQPTAQPEQPYTNTNTNDGAVENDWLFAQPESNYSLQLMVLGKLEPILTLQKKYQDIGQEIRYVKRIRNGKERFIVIYGSFANLEAANNQKNLLPKEFKQAIPRSVGAIIKDLK